MKVRTEYTAHGNSHKMAENKNKMKKSKSTAGVRSLLACFLLRSRMMKATYQRVSSKRFIPADITENISQSFVRLF